MRERRSAPDDSVRPGLRREPAPPPENALLALQRSAGNQAVTRRLVQRFKASAASEAEHMLAEAKHARDRDALAAAVLASLESPDERLRNSAQWIVEGKALLYALTPTADSTDRAKTANKPDMRALFGYPDPDPFKDNHVAGHVFDSSVASYDQADLETNTRVTFDSPDSGGFRTPTGRKIFLIEPSRIDAINALRKEIGKPGTFAPITEALKHETQHEADLDFGTEVATAKGDADLALVEYRTEYRAYTAQGADWLNDPPRPKDVEKIGLHFPDPKQFQIFLQIYKGYPRVKQAWDSDAKLDNGEPFRTAVLEMRGPIERISENPYNSPRVDGFHKLVGGVNLRDNPEDPLTRELIGLLQRFDDHDRQAIGRSRRYPWEGTRNWLRTLVDALLDDPAADVDASLAEERQRRRQQAEAERTEARRKPPTRGKLTKAFKNWPDVRKCLESVRTSDNIAALEDEEVKDELQTWADESSDFGTHVEAFVGNLHPKIDWWTILETRGV